MAIVNPFAALRPDPALAAHICELPYDVVTTAEARALAADQTLSFFHISKPEIDLDNTINPYDSCVYANGRERFTKLISDGALKQDAVPHYYAYRQVMGSHTQFGIVGLASCEEYLHNIVRKHELTRPDKEDDRVRHLEALNAQTGPAFLTYPADSVIDDCVRAATAGQPDVDFVAADGVRHTTWTITSPAHEKTLQSRFAALPALYIADGHHRSAAAARVYKTRQGAGSSGYFLSVLFPADQVQILPYHRVLKDLNGLSPAEVLQHLETVCAINSPGRPTPSSRHEFSLYLSGRWDTLRFHQTLTASRDALEQLDVTLLQNHVLAPVFGIEDPRRSHRIDFVGGIRGTGELERLVTSGAHACAFSMFPTSIDELMAIAEVGRLMPPKSTWFEPKLRDGLFSHMLG
jgi:uncharacterized protein (DUF1015 family)